MIVRDISGSERSLRSADIVSLWVCGWVSQSVPIILCSTALLKGPKSSQEFLRVPKGNDRGMMSHEHKLELMRRASESFRELKRAKEES